METLSPFAIDFGVAYPLAEPSSANSSLGSYGQGPVSGAFLPSLHELRTAAALLDMNGDGKIWESDLDALVELAYGVNARCTHGSWKALKSACEEVDGLMSLSAVLREIDCGRVHAEILKMPRSFSAPDTTARCGSQAGAGPSAVELGSFDSLVDYVETFNKFDCDHNGVICAKDLKQALLAFTGVQFTVSECKDMIRRVDTTFDGVIELIEFGALMKYLSRS